MQECHHPNPRRSRPVKLISPPAVEHRSIKIVHFNTRSVLRKWDEVVVDMQSINADIFCISESWITSPDDFSKYVFKNFVTFGNCRPSKDSGGVLMCVNPQLRPVSCNQSNSISCCNGYNWCAVKLLNSVPPTSVITVYRPDDTSASDTSSLFKELTPVLQSIRSCIIVGDFNFREIRDWSQPISHSLSGAANYLVKFMLDFDLTQLQLDPTRGDNILDLVLVTPALTPSEIYQLEPIANSDHKVQVIETTMHFHEPAAEKSTSSTTYNKIDYPGLRVLLRQIDWTCQFMNSRDVDEFVSIFYIHFNNCIQQSLRSLRRRKHNACDLPRHIVQLIRKKRAAWRMGAASGDYEPYRLARNTARRAIRNYHIEYEKSLISRKNRSRFFKYVNKRLGSQEKYPSLTDGGNVLSNEEMAESFSNEFTKNFSAITQQPILNNNDSTIPSSRDDNQLLLNCTVSDVIAAIKRSANSCAGFDGLSFKTIKEVVSEILSPLTIICQQSLSQGKFPTEWKCAKVVPIYKGKGNRESASCYRPISICNCLSKILESVVREQLQKHIDKIAPLSNNQYGFREGRSTTANLLACDAIIYKFMNNNKPFDLLSFDFMRAFDKVPHYLVIKALERLQLHPISLKWFMSYFNNREQIVAIQGARSNPSKVSSGVIQGSVLATTCFNIVIDSLLQQLNDILGPNSFAFADDLKFVTGTSVTEHAVAQTAVDAIHEWSESHHMPLSSDKNIVQHYGNNNPGRVYILGNTRLPKADLLKDLGVTRSTTNMYGDHIDKLSFECRRLAGCLFHVFRSRDKDLLWSAFLTYVKPKIMYASPAWSPLLKNKIDALEKVQKRFTKRLHGFHDYSYDERLKSLETLSLSHSRMMADLVFIHRCLHSKVQFSLNDIGLSLSNNNCRSGKLRLLQQRPVNSATASLFVSRVASEWNNLSSVTYSNSLINFKLNLTKYFSSFYQ